MTAEGVDFRCQSYNRRIWLRCNKLTMDPPTVAVNLGSRGIENLSLKIITPGQVNRGDCGG